jgi:signal transduction histidine kinase
MTVQLPFDLESAIAPMPLVIDSELPLLEALIKLNQFSQQLNFSACIDTELTRCALVTQPQGYVGVITQQHIIDRLTARVNLETQTIREIIQPNLKIIARSHLKDIASTIELFCQHCVEFFLVVNPQDQPVGILSHRNLLSCLHFIEIGERLQACKQQTALKQEVKELKSRFITLTSHQLRTPLSVITSSAGILKEFGKQLDEEKIQKHLQRIQTYVKYLTQILDDILLLNKANTNYLAFEPTQLDIHQFCVVLVQEFQLSETHCTIRFSIQDAIALQSIRPALDEKLLRQILINLLSNAAKYSPVDSIVDFKLSLQDQQLIFTIQDEGIGIPQDEQSQIFQPFYRASNVGNIAGIGLGLVTVQKCVELHQGQISVISQQIQGTTFTIGIPIQPRSALFAHD